MRGTKASGNDVRRALALLASSLASIVLLLALAPIARPASRFTIDYCDAALPGGNPPPFEFHDASGFAYAPWNSCAAPGGGMAIIQTGQAMNQSAWINVGIAETPGGFVESETISGYVWNLQPGNEQSHIFSENWPLSGGGDTPRVFRIRTQRDSLNVGGFPIVLACSASPCNPGGQIVANDIAVNEVDLYPPVIGGLTGSLLGGGTLHGHQSLAAEAGDVGSGVNRVDVLVNGFPATAPTPRVCDVAQVSNLSYQGLAATSPRPCPSGLPGSWTLDTATYPFHEGDNTVQVCASDLATTGNPNTTCSPPQTVSVDNSCTDSPVGGGQALSVDFVQSSSEEVKVPSGISAEVKGELANNAGDLISGATICVEAQTEGTSGEPAPVATTTTDASGHFSYQVPSGPNRRFLIGYRHDSFQIGRTISYSAYARPTLNVRPGRIHEGERVRIFGQLPQPDAGGRVVVLQASALHGRRWLTFRRATTAPDGSFESTYRFGATSRTMTYRIRTIVPKQSGYPYEPGRSKAARVKVQIKRKRHSNRREH